MRTFPPSELRHAPVRPSSRRALAAAGALVVVAVSACGGSKHPANQQVIARQQVTTAVRSYLQAQVAGDGQTACGLLTSAGQQQLSTLVMQASNGLLKSPPSCENAVGLVRALAGSKLLTALGHARVEQVRVSGTSASAEVVDGTAFPAQQVSLQKLGAAWKIAAVPGLGS